MNQLKTLLPQQFQNCQDRRKTKNTTLAAITQSDGAPPLVHLILRGAKSPVRDHHLRQLHHSDAVVLLDLSDNPHITDAGISHLTSLVTLKLARNTRITNDALARFTSLTTLCLEGNGRITELSALPRLTTLSLACCWEAGVGDEALAKLTQLTSLSLAENTVITRAGLAPLRNLRYLDVSFAEDIAAENGHLDPATTEVHTQAGYYVENGSVVELTVMRCAAACLQFVCHGTLHSNDPVVV
jgi:hypothetical protein